jgi:hypothetical protein
MTNGSGDSSPLGKATAFGLTFAVFATAVSGLSYGLLYEAYSIFYSRFGTNPEEAGLDRNALLSQAIWLPLFGLLFESLCYTLLVAVAISLALLIVAFVWYLFSDRSLGNTMSHVFRWTFGVMRHWRAIIVFTLVMVTLAATTVYREMRSEADYAAASIRDGRVFTSQQARFQYPIIQRGWNPSFEMKLRGEHVDVSWFDHRPDTFITDSKCLVLLGQPSSTSLVYDVQNRILWRIPNADATFRTRLDKDSDAQLRTCVRARVP